MREQYVDASDASQWQCGTFQGASHLAQLRTQLSSYVDRMEQGRNSLLEGAQSQKLDVTEARCAEGVER